MDLKEMDLVDPERNWYYRSKSRYLLRALTQKQVPIHRVVDVGAGSGFFTTKVIQAFPGSTAVCVDPNYTHEHSSADRSIQYVRHASPAVIRDADLFLFIDVLEHVDEDIDLLNSYVELATAGALFAISVPAFKSLWSPHDDFLEHRRRYRLSELVGVCEHAGLIQLSHTYLFGTLFAPVWITRRLRRGGPPRSDLSQPTPLVNGLLEWVSRADSQLPIRRFCGLSAFYLGTKG